jgi:2'-5' RNA ligase
MQAGDRLVCAFVEHANMYDTFRAWPLHVTILPWFRLADASDAITHGLEAALRSVNPFEVTMGEQTTFGPRHDRPATLVRLPTPLTDIERRTRSYFHKKRAWLVDETTKVRREFRPHVTAQGDKLMQAGDMFACDRLYVVEQKGGYKEIAGEVLLNNE